MSMIMSLKYGTFKNGLHQYRNMFNPYTSQVLRYCCGSGDKVKLRAQTEMQNYWEKNLKGPRPYSPHLLIYKMELPMLTSLLHRGSGIAMAIAWAGIGIGGFFYTGHYDEMINFISNMHFAAPILFGAKFIMCWPLIFHYINGMRHLAYDAALGFEVKTTMTTGYIALAVSFIIATLFASIKLSA